ncbi:helix-turn-helix domain-containing protein [Actinoplanes bogorensis]|uniref:Helix-turn-helix domain-containing protein n=1 Tax=Paractinoplanes bogorensis TaxID=1610840 RepID=A0ABS5Z4M8_9ACTN|nr:helix-turn-helix transcriptional regulator [Actinoplanes bogorensis]MBU2670643.1 helix-turn-helix domain-containing protein [Actinoplanes bogorensis]
MNDLPLPDEDADEPVGAVLARWRKRRKLSGHALGELVNMSQAKISRLETGASPADPQDVRLIAEALDLSPDEVDRLVGLAERSDEVGTDWQPMAPNLSSQQNFVRRLEAPIREMRIFQPAVVVGLLQTSEYARAILSAFRTELDDDKIADSALAVSEAVAVRIQRSQALDDPNRRFDIIMSETVLAHQVCGPTDMLGQINRLREVAQQPNVTIRLVPENALWPFPPLHGFELMDDRYVIVDLMNGSMNSRGGRRIVRQYQRVFRAIESAAVSEIGPILDKYQKRYIRLLPGAA